MSELRIVVCMKVVPKPEEIRVDPETHRLKREVARSEFNPPDMNALEASLSLKDLHGGRITILSMGPDFWASYLKLALAMGADEVVLLSDRAFAGADTLATTYTLAQGITKIIKGADLIFCGEESSDGATGQVPPGLAEWLDVAQITMATDVAVDRKAGVVRGKREIKGGYELLEVPMPAVISIKTAANEPRFMDYTRKDWALEEGPVQVCDAATLKADGEFIGVPGSPTIVTGLEQAESRERKRIFLEGDPQEVGGKLGEILGVHLGK